MYEWMFCGGNVSLVSFMALQDDECLNWPKGLSRKIFSWIGSYSWVIKAFHLRLNTAYTLHCKKISQIQMMMMEISREISSSSSSVLFERVFVPFMTNGLYISHPY